MEREGKDFVWIMATLAGGKVGLDEVFPEKEANDGRQEVI